MRWGGGLYSINFLKFRTKYFYTNTEINANENQIWLNKILIFEIIVGIAFGGYCAVEDMHIKEYHTLRFFKHF